MPVRGWHRAAALSVAAASIWLAAARPAPPTESASITARPVPLDATDPARTSVDRLRYMGGLALSSTDRRFGGLSGMRFLPDGQLLAISDAGDWLQLRLIETRGRLTGAADLRITRMTDSNGQPIRGKAMGDAEGLAIEPDGTRLVSFERDHRVMAYPPDGRAPRLVAFPDRLWLSRLAPNSGLEAMERAGDLRLYLSEDPGPGGVNLILAPRGRAQSYGRAVYAAPAGYKPTDMATLDDRSVLVLNRMYSPLTGVSAVLMRVAVDPGRLTTGAAQRVATLSPPVTVDNMEALAIRREGGRTFLYIGSDDNFSPLQRTIILKFELLP